MSIERRQEILEVLDCDIGVRPQAAPGVAELLPFVRGLGRQGGVLLVEFESSASQTLERFVEAERLCCAGIDWAIEGEPGLRLRITASEAQLAVLENLWRDSDIEKFQ